MGKRPTLASWLGAALLLLSSGCTAAERRPEAGSAAPSAVVGPADPQDVVFRPKRFFDDMETIQRATERLTRSCMTRLGLRYDGVAQLVDRSQGGLPVDMGFRAAHGYGFAEALRPVWQPPDQHADAWYRALEGPPGSTSRWKTIAGVVDVPDGGCIGKARSRVAGSGREWFWAVDAQQDYWLVVAASIPNDARWGAAVRAWSRCMADHGRADLKGPMQAWTAAREQVFRQYEESGRVTSRVKQEEVDIATLDGRCASSSGLMATDQAIRADFLDQAPPEFLRDLRRIARAQTQALRTIERDGLDP